MIVVEMILFHGDKKEKLRFFIETPADLGVFVKCLCGYSGKLFLEIYKNE